MEKDPIQRKNRAGAFYETSDLSLLDPYFPNGSSFLDIGATIGSLSLYFALILRAAQVIAVKSKPFCWNLLIENVLVNGLWIRFDLTRLGVGAGDARHRPSLFVGEAENNDAGFLTPGWLRRNARWS